MLHFIDKILIAEVYSYSILYWEDFVDGNPAWRRPEPIKEERNDV
jgi:hypothetical protein